MLIELLSYPCPYCHGTGKCANPSLSLEPIFSTTTGGTVHISGQPVPQFAQREPEKKDTTTDDALLIASMINGFL